MLDLLAAVALHEVLPFSRVLATMLPSETDLRFTPVVGAPFQLDRRSYCLRRVWRPRGQDRLARPLSELRPGGPRRCGWPRRRKRGRRGARFGPPHPEGHDGEDQQADALHKRLQAARSEDTPASRHLSPGRSAANGDWRSPISAAPSSGGASSAARKLSAGRKRRQAPARRRQWSRAGCACGRWGRWRRGGGQRCHSPRLRARRDRWKRSSQNARAIRWADRAAAASLPLR